MADNDALYHALRLRDRKISVFPVSVRTKVPAVSWDRYQDELPTESEIRNDFAYAQRNGECAVGIATGPVSDALLLDFDFAKHPAAREFYEKHRHHFPRTWHEETGSGGWHFYFRWDDALNLKQTNTTSKLHLGVDTKGYGGYSKICPSPGYKWLIPPHMAPLARCPQWLIDALPLKEKRDIADANKKPEDWMIRELENVDASDPINGRTPTFVRAIGRLKAKGLSQTEVEALLQPWAAKYEYPKLAGLVVDQFQRYPPREEAQPSAALTNHSYKSFMAKRKTVPFIVPGFFARSTINVLAGLQESRKSWLLLDLAVAVATGTAWMGKWPCTRGKVILLDQERPPEEMQRRLDALIKGRGLSDDDVEGSLIPKAGLEPPFQLNLDQSFEAFEKMIAETRPDLVLIDSLKTIQSGRVNESAAMQPFFERVKALRLKYRTAFVILHHENNRAYEMIRDKQTVTAETIEGSSTIKQVPEGLFVARNFDGSSTMLHHVKNSYGLKAAPFLVKVRDLTPGGDQIAVEAF